MQIQLISQCIRDLDFSPTKPWPKTLPGIAWGQICVAGFAQNTVVNVATHSEPQPQTEEQAKEFAQVMADAHSHFSLRELAQLRQRLGQHLKMAEMIFTHLLICQGLRNSETLLEILDKLPQLPVEFQNWCEARDLGARELSIIKCFSEVSGLAPLALTIAQLGASRAHGVQLLELGGELLLMGHTWQDAKPDTGTSEAWLKKLESQRRPQTHARDQQKQEALSSLPWPEFLHTRLLRQGDKASLEVKFQFSTLEEFQKKNAGLMRVQAAFENLQSEGTP